MKNLDIRIDLDFFDNPKTQKTVFRLGSEFYECIFRLWMFVAKFRPDGILADIDQDEVEFIAKWSGDKGLFFETVTSKKTNWIDFREDGLMEIHDWLDWNPWAAKQKERSAKAKQAAMQMWRNKQCSTDASSNATSIAKNINEQYPTDTKVNNKHCQNSKNAMPPTQPNPTQEVEATAATSRKSKTVTAVQKQTPVTVEDFKEFQNPALVLDAFKETTDVSVYKFKQYLTTYILGGMNPYPWEIVESAMMAYIGLSLPKKQLTNLMGCCRKEKEIWMNRDPEQPKEKPPLTEETVREQIERDKRLDTEKDLRRINELIQMAIDDGDQQRILTILEKRQFRHHFALYPWLHETAPWKTFCGLIRKVAEGDEALGQEIEKHLACEKRKG